MHIQGVDICAVLTILAECTASVCAVVQYAQSMQVDRCSILVQSATDCLVETQHLSALDSAICYKCRHHMSGSRYGIHISAGLPKYFWSCKLCILLQN